MKKMLMLLATFAFAPAVPALADVSCTENCVKQMTTHFSGRPPFKRSFEMVAASEVEQREAAVRKKATLRGRPPYKNRFGPRSR
ncbi:MAG: hypothetical protein ACJA09_001294 [Alcanivorax sp.]|jgi:hypothetical protein